MKFAIFQESRIGRRKLNQDRMNYAYTRDALLMVVADGMGGHLHGELAAQIAVQTLSQSFRQQAQTTLADPFMFLSRALSQAHLAINRHTAEQGLSESPRTTCVACVIQHNTAHWAHVGDSRLYMIRQGQVAALTRDHSHVRLLIEQGQLDEEGAASHPARNLVYSCLGGPSPPEIEFSRKTPLQRGDVIALCSDGAWAPVSKDIFANTLSCQSPAQAVPQLLDLAEAAAGKHCDNLTLLAMQWESHGTHTSQQNRTVLAHPVAAAVADMAGESAAAADPDSVMAMPLPTPK